MQRRFALLDGFGIGYQIIRWKVPSKVHAVVQHAANFQIAIDCHSVQQEMPRLANATNLSADVIPAVAQMVSHCPFRQFRPLEGSGSTWVVLQIQNRLNNQRFVAQANLLAEVAVRPGEDCFDVLFGLRGESKSGHRLLGMLSFARFSGPATDFGDRFPQAPFTRHAQTLPLIKRPKAIVSEFPE